MKHLKNFSEINEEANVPPRLQNSKTGEEIRHYSEKIICPKEPMKRDLTSEEQKKMYANFSNHSWSHVDADNRIILGGGENACGKYWIDADDLKKLGTGGTHSQMKG